MLRCSMRRAGLRTPLPRVAVCRPAMCALRHGAWRRQLWLKSKPAPLKLQFFTKPLPGHRGTESKVVQLIGLFILVGGILLIINLENVPVTNRRRLMLIPRSVELQMGREAFQDMLNKLKPLRDVKRKWIVDMVERVVTRLAVAAEEISPNFHEWRFCVVDDDEVVNAVCFPGGKILVFTGLIKLMQAEASAGRVPSLEHALAVVLAHEVGHAVARHAAETVSWVPVLGLVSPLTGQSMLLSFVFDLAVNRPISRMHELEADAMGMVIMSAACYDPSCAPAVLRSLKGTPQHMELVSTHPADENRAARCAAMLPATLPLLKAHNCDEQVMSVQEAIRRTLPMQS